jgi:hypothetical protein
MPKNVNLKPRLASHQNNRPHPSFLPPERLGNLFIYNTPHDIIPLSLKGFLFILNELLIQANLGCRGQQHGEYLPAPAAFPAPTRLLNSGSTSAGQKKACNAFIRNL